MIDVNAVWDPQIISYAEIVSDSDMLSACWTLGECEKTSVTSFSELIEQLFDDLDSENSLKDAQLDASVPDTVVNSISKFLAAIEAADEVEESGIWQYKPEFLLSSPLWQVVVDQANNLLEVATAAGYKAMR